jgi:DNA-binding NarL/FixJ family response regulator
MKILLIDDHALVREALPAVLTKLKPEACVFEASNTGGALRITEEIPDLDLWCSTSTCRTGTVSLC